MTLTELWQTIQAGGLPFVLFLILVTGFREMWVWGYLYRAVIKDRDEWKRLALSGTSLARHATRKVEADSDGARDEEGRGR